jgi:hypothetical protein
MTEPNGRADVTRSPGHGCRELCGPGGQPCECPPCNCPACLEQTARAQDTRPHVQDLDPRPGPPESLF